MWAGAVQESKAERGTGAATSSQKHNFCHASVWPCVESCVCVCVCVCMCMSGCPSCAYREIQTKTCPCRHAAAQHGGYRAGVLTRGSAWIDALLSANNPESELRQRNGRPSARTLQPRRRQPSLAARGAAVALRRNAPFCPSTSKRMSPTTTEPVRAAGPAHTPGAGSASVSRADGGQMQPGRRATHLLG